MTDPLPGQVGIPLPGMHTKVCPVCKRPFHSKRSDAVYCPGSRCRVAAHRASNAKKPPAPIAPDARVLKLLDELDRLALDPDVTLPAEYSDAIHALRAGDVASILEGRARPSED